MRFCYTYGIARIFGVGFDFFKMFECRWRPAHAACSVYLFRYGGDFFAHGVGVGVGEADVALRQGADVCNLAGELFRSRAALCETFRYHRLGSAFVDEFF